MKKGSRGSRQQQERRLFVPACFCSCLLPLPPDFLFCVICGLLRGIALAPAVEVIKNCSDNMRTIAIVSLNSQEQAPTIRYYTGENNGCL
jgi:hypothetical protein